MTQATVKTVKTPAIVAPVFDKYALAIIKAKTQAHGAMTKADASIDATMQQFTDAWAIAGYSKSQADVARLGKAIRDSEAVKNMTETTWLKRKTFTEYAQSAMRAFFHGVPFSASLKGNPDMGLPWGGAKGDKKNASGTVVSTTREALDKTLIKALEQARLLGLTEFAADMLDLCIDRLDSFKE